MTLAEGLSMNTMQLHRGKATCVTLMLPAFSGQRHVPRNKEKKTPRSMARVSGVWGVKRSDYILTTRRTE